VSGRTLGQEPPPALRIFGDPGACPGTPAIEAVLDDGNPRLRIVRAAVLLRRGQPVPLSPCAMKVQR
jgi:hypothetical protein